jgi:hypothetical protein
MITWTRYLYLSLVFPEILKLLLVRLPVFLELLKQGCGGQNIRSRSTLTLRSDLHTIITDHNLGHHPVTRLECPVVPLHMLDLSPQLLGKFGQPGQLCFKFVYFLLPEVKEFPIAFGLPHSL